MKYDSSLQEIRVEMKFGNGGFANVYSPRKGFRRFRKSAGWFVALMGMRIMFGRKGWTAFFNCERKRVRT